MEDIVRKELDTLLSLMGIEAEYSMELEKNEEVTYIKVSFTGENLGYLIGGHGKHLDSLQYVLSMVVRKHFKEDEQYRVILDVGGYRKERDEKLEKFAMQKADDARILGEPIDLPPMKASDRRVVHMTLQMFDDVKTESVGEDRERHIRIIPTNEKDMDVLSSSEEEQEESEE
ncbi:MAG: KH domain-containing protein [Candidatus Dojkabacteria bacterium]|jgi:spoIIIJ-associated protein|nr:KH domain-containing protein [Candidatus Dojkabacteria bacterium]